MSIWPNDITPPFPFLTKWMVWWKQPSTEWTLWPHIFIRWINLAIALESWQNFHW